MRYLGIDFGKKNIGIAVSDPSESFAIPLSVIPNSENVISEISKICKKNNIEVIVVGESRDFSLKENEIMKEITPFVRKLVDEVNIQVYMHPEFLTSMEARRLQGENNMNDASAASLILKSYLDTKNTTAASEQ